MTTWLITGCSSGLGRALAEAVLARGENVVATSRDAAALQGLIQAHPDTTLALDLDVTDPAQAESAIKQANSRFAGVDVLVNNAGYGFRAAIEEGDVDEVDALFATNFFGAVAMMKAVLPGMRSSRSGTIVNISSTGTLITPAGSGYYAASKAALEAASASLRKEVEPLGLRVIVVEPGQFRTDFAGRSLTQSATVIADYAETAGKRRIEHDTAHGNQPGDPIRAAEAIIAAVKAPEPPLVLLLGSDAVDQFRTTRDATSADMDKWLELSMSTDFNHGEPTHQK